MKFLTVMWCSILISLLFACSRGGKGIDVKISNESGSKVSNVNFATSEKLDSLSFDLIRDKEIRAERLSMARNQTDGDYVLRFTLDGKQRVLAHGYYTNGGPLDSSVSYVIKSDTVLVKFDPEY